MVRFLLLILFLNASLVTQAQVTISGIVLFDEDNKPANGASVFLSNTSFGTVTNADGAFAINHLPSGKYDLIITYVGYETIIKSIDVHASSNLKMTFYLKSKPKELQEVVVGGYEKQTWEKWGKFFLDNFLGTSSNSMRCNIKNTSKIEFQFYKKQNIIKAFCDEELIIINKALGYKIKYKLELFEYDFGKKLLYYEGYPYFESIVSKREKKNEQYINARQKAYEGSIMHFMRSLYRNNIEEQGFQVRRMQQDTNYEKMRVKQIFRDKVLKNMNINLKRNWSDSSEYYESVLKQQDVFTSYSAYTIKGDSIAYAADSVTAVLSFPNLLHITYVNGVEENGYLQNVLHTDRKAKAPSSTLAINGDHTILVLQSGYYYKGLNLINGGYWAWNDKIGNMLPYDYKLPVSK